MFRSWAMVPLMLCLFSVPSFGQETFRRGDVNDDGIITAHDACLIMHGMFIDDFFVCPDAADVNDDGGIDLSDHTLLLSLLFSIVTSLPDPDWMVCGEDPTADELGPCVYESCGIPATLGSTFFIRGDCDQTAAVDVMDAMFGLEMLFEFGPTSNCLEACDANGDGRIDVADSIFTLSFLYTLGAPPPSPYPNCSTEPTDCFLSFGCASGSAACP